MIVLGLTGSIGMGKSTAGTILHRLGVPVHDADHAVHELIAPGGAALPAIGAAFPYYEYPHIYAGRDKDKRRVLDRQALGALVFNNEIERNKLENIVHPLVHEAQQNFIRKEQALGRGIVALDIPLLFETGADRRVDYTFVVSAPAQIQKARVMARPGMTAEKFAGILKAQMPDDEKRRRADFVIPTGLGRAVTTRALKKALRAIKEREGLLTNEKDSHEQKSSDIYPSVE